jgi:hypothetical protein
MVPVRKLVVDETKIKKNILSKLPFTITTFSLSRETEVYIEEVITIFLELAGQEKLKDRIFYCVMELATNAKKANTKRVYFSELGLDIANQDDYQKGMEHFRKTTLNNMAYYLQLQKERGLYIKLILQIRENTLHIEIRNNVTATHDELTRIHERLAISRQLNNLDEALSQTLDDSEGAGLGLVTLVLMLKKMDLGEDCLKIHATEHETVAQLVIPLKMQNTIQMFS